MRLLEKFVEQSKLVHQLECGRMNSVTAKIAKEIGMFFQNDHGHTGSREQVASHDPGWSAACDHTTRLQFFSHAFSIEYGSNQNESKYASESTSTRCVYLQRSGGFLRRIATWLLGLFRTSNDRTGFTFNR